METKVLFSITTINKKKTQKNIGHNEFLQPTPNSLFSFFSLVSVAGSADDGVKPGRKSLHILNNVRYNVHYLVIL